MIFRDDNLCFACGQDNPQGLKLRFEINPDSSVATRFTPDRRFQGYKNILHGGIITTLLDEVMAQAVIAQKIMAVTAKIEVNFKKPVRIGAPLIITGRLLDKKGRFCTTAAELTDFNGVIYSTAKAVFVPIKKGYGQ